MPPVADAESLRQALDSTYKVNPKIDAERARLRATDEEVPQARSGWLPTVHGTAEFGQTAHHDQARDLRRRRYSTRPAYGLNVSQQVFNGFRTVNTVAEAEAVVRAGRENLRQVESRDACSRRSPPMSTWCATRRWCACARATSRC